MKKYLFLIFIILIPSVYANSIPHGIYNVYLDDQFLTEFKLKQVLCFPIDTNITLHPNLLLVSNDSEKNCTWVMDKFVECKKNPCSFSIISRTRLYLETQNKTILTNEINESKIGQYNLYISSDGSTELEFLKKVKDNYGMAILLVGLLIIIPLSLINALIESIVAYFYFRIKGVSYRKLWNIVFANMITFIPFIIIISLLDIYGIIIAEIIIVSLEASFYAWKIKELDWKNVIALSLIANIVTVTVSIIVRMVWF